MFGLTAWDPASDAIQRASSQLSGQDERTARTISAFLVDFYRGDQMAWVDSYIRRLFKNPKYQARHTELASFQNVTRFLIDRVTAFGQRPLGVKWMLKDGTESARDAEIWDEIAEEMNFDLLMSDIGRYSMLVKTVVALPSWDAEDGCVDLHYYTPNVVEVDCLPRKGSDCCPSPRRPTIFKILESSREGEVCWQTWDFRPNGPALVTSEMHDGKEEPWPVMDPERPDRALVPFVAFRTAAPTSSYFVTDGQSDLYEGQTFINAQWSAIAYALHWATFKIPVATGPGWKGVQIPTDPSEVLVCPDDPAATQQPNIEWKGPASAADVDTALKAIAAKRDAMAETFHVDPSVFENPHMSRSESGIAIAMRQASLRGRMENTRLLYQSPTEKLVDNIVAIWNFYQPDPARRFSADVEPSITIPDVGMAIDPASELAMDLQKLDAGIVTPASIVAKYNPSAKPEELKSLEEALISKRMPVAPPPALPQSTGKQFFISTPRPAVPGTPMNQAVPQAPPQTTAAVPPMQR